MPDQQPSLWQLAIEATTTTTPPTQAQQDAQSTVQDVAGTLDGVRRVAEAMSARSVRSGWTAMLGELTPQQAGLVTGALELIRAVWAQASPYPFPEIYEEAQPVVEPVPPVVDASIVATTIWDEPDGEVTYTGTSSVEPVVEPVEPEQ
jgi:hypothetical protein